MRIHHVHVLKARCWWVFQTPHKTATVGLYIDAGSRFETAKNNGCV